MAYSTKKKNSRLDLIIICIKLSLTPEKKLKIIQENTLKQLKQVYQKRYPQRDLHLEPVWVGKIKIEKEPPSRQINNGASNPYQDN